MTLYHACSHPAMCVDVSANTASLVPESDSLDILMIKLSEWEKLLELRRQTWLFHWFIWLWKFLIYLLTFSVWSQKCIRSNLLLTCMNLVELGCFQACFPSEECFVIGQQILAQKPWNFFLMLWDEDIKIKIETPVFMYFHGSKNKNTIMIKQAWHCWAAAGDGGGSVKAKHVESSDWSQMWRLIWFGGGVYCNLMSTTDRNAVFSSVSVLLFTFFLDLGKC